MFDTGPSPGNDIQSNMYSVYSMLEREMAKKTACTSIYNN